MLMLLATALAVASCHDPLVGEGDPDSVALSVVQQQTGLRLTYLCGNRFRIRTTRRDTVRVRWDVDRTADTGSVVVPGVEAPATQRDVDFETTARGTTRIFLGAQVVDTKANGGTGCAESISVPDNPDYRVAEADFIAVDTTVGGAIDRYYRRVADVVVRTGTTDASLRETLSRLGAEIIFGAPSFRSYIIRLPDLGPSASAYKQRLELLRSEAVFQVVAPVIDQPPDFRSLGPQQGGLRLTTQVFPGAQVVDPMTNGGSNRTGLSLVPRVHKIPASELELLVNVASGPDSIRFYRRYAEVVFRDGTPVATIRDVMARYGASPVRKGPRPSYFVIVMPDLGADPAAYTERMRRLRSEASIVAALGVSPDPMPTFPMSRFPDDDRLGRSERTTSPTRRSPGSREAYAWTLVAEGRRATRTISEVSSGEVNAGAHSFITSSNGVRRSSVSSPGTSSCEWRAGFLRYPHSSGGAESWGRDAHATA